MFGIDRVVQNKVGTEVFGSYFALFNMVIIFQIFLDMGIENFTRKEVAHDPKSVNKLFSGFLVLKLILIIIFIGTLSILGQFLPLTKEEWKFLLILLINQSLANLILFLRANLGGLHLFKTESFVSVFDRIFMILVCGTLLYFPFSTNKFKIEWFLYTQSAAYLATVLIGIVLLVRKTGMPRFRFSTQENLEVIKKLLPYATLVLLMSFYYRIDSVFLRYLLPDGKTQAGIYAHSFRLLDFMSNYALIFSFILLPLFAKMVNQKDQIRSLLKLSALTLIIPSIILISGIVFYRYEVFNLLYNSHTILSANTFMILIISYIGVCFSYTFGALLTANGNLRELNTMAIVAVVLSILLNMILIPRFKVTGAAITNGITQSFTILFHYIVVKKKFQLSVNPKLILKVTLFLTFTFISGWLITQSEINWILGCIAISLFSGIFAILFRLINLSYIKTLIRFNKQE